MRIVTTSRARVISYARKFAFRPTESRTRNNPRAISRTWKRTLCSSTRANFSRTISHAISRTWKTGLSLAGTSPSTGDAYMEKELDNSTGSTFPRAETRVKSRTWKAPLKLADYNFTGNICNFSERKQYQRPSCCHVDLPLKVQKSLSCSNMNLLPDSNYSYVRILS